MRVITGSLKGRKLYSVPGTNTRPTSDKTKETIFHKIGPYFDGGTALDLFAGSGSLGIEAISRGIDHVVFIDQSPSAIRTIKKNIESLSIENCTSIYRNDAIRALQILAKQNKQFDLIFIDPPYKYKKYEQALSLIEQNKLIKEQGFIYIEYSPKMQPTYNEDVFHLFYEKKFSSTIAVMILQYSPS